MNRPHWTHDKRKRDAATKKRLETRKKNGKHKPTGLPLLPTGKAIKPKALRPTVYACPHCGNPVVLA